MCELKKEVVEGLYLLITVNSSPPKKRRAWMTRGFKKISKEKLVDYWMKKIPTDPKAMEIYCNLYPKDIEKNGIPSISIMAGTFVTSMKNWAQSGFKTANQEIFNSRISICKQCPEWDKDAFAGSGRCNKCGCSTQAKLRMATEKCPIGKW